MKRSLLFVLLAPLAGLLWSGCDMINPSEPTPTYVQIDSFFFKPPSDPIATAGYTHKINSCWVTLDGKTIGVFDLPAKVPIILSKPGKLLVAPGVVINGMNDYLVQYPYYSGDTTTLSPKPGEVVTFTPKTGYYTDTKFPWKEDFEGGNDLGTRLSGDTDLVRSNMPAAKLDGGYSGYIVLKSPQKDMEAITVSTFKASGQNVTMEIDYRSSMPFYIGLQSVEGNTFKYVLGINPRSERNKIYIALGSFLSSFQSSTGYRLQIRAELPSGQSEGFVAIDNLKIVSFDQ